jgi:MYXO-CTERM domain-containing protein
MATRTRTAAALALALAALAAPGSALADAVPPAPDDCPKGEVGTTSHSGPSCVKEPPKDCPTGWRGTLGGTCMLTPCATDANCQPGEACVEHAVCLAPYPDDFYEYGEEEREKHGMLEPIEGSLFRSPGLLAGPPMQKTRRPKPILRYNATNVCSREVACAAPATCQTEKLCVPKGRRALAYRGSNVAPVRVARKTEAALTASAAEATEASADLPTAGPGARGCGACASSTQAAGGAWAAGAAALVLALGRRRTRRRAGDPPR